LVSVIAAFLIGSIELMQVAISFIKQGDLKFSWLANLNLNQLGIDLSFCLLAIWLFSYLKWQHHNAKSSF
jgi:high-affinity nickel-transport protein